MTTMLATNLAPDLILFNAAITTFAPALPRCSALACGGGRVLAIGDDAQVRALAGPQTRLLDLGGRTVVPGFNDAHNHLIQVGLKMEGLQLDNCDSIAELVAMVARAAEQTPAGTWIVGDGWNDARFAEGRLPRAADLDQATTRHPVLLKRFFNMDVINSLALDRAGISAATPDPPGGAIERDASGAPNGILRASAKQLCRSLLPEPSREEMVAAIARAGQRYLEVGITSILDPGLTPAEIGAYLQARQQGRLPLRASLLVAWHGFLDGETRAELEARATALGGLSGLGDRRLRLSGLKMAIDGGTTSRTAWMFEPFVGETTVRDFNRLDPAELRAFFQQAHALGWDVGIHAIGDRAHHEAALAFADVLAAGPPRDHRHNLIHGYFASQESMAAMARHELAVVIQPTFIYFEGDDLFRDVGEARAHRYKPMRSYLDHGIRVVATSDVPSTPHYNPFVGLYSLVTRKTQRGTPIAPHEAVSRAEALYAYSVAGAWLSREERFKGPLAPGYFADLAVLDRDYFSCPEEEIAAIQVDATILGGEVVYARDPALEVR
jgi:predicted amidohydrolase YtcJ